MDKIGKYEVLEEVGKGGFGVVFKGRDPFIRRLVAIKTCSSDSDEIRQRFFREAQIAGNLHHTNVVTIHDFGLENETPFIVQEYIKGEDLDQKIKGRHPLTFEQKLRYLAGIAEGLGYAHSKGVVHRDIKPSNIRITHDGLPKVMDFGIAKLSHVKSHLTQTGTTLGTVTYLAPEQLKGSKVDNRCDIFSYGVMAYELFAYQRPFDGESVSQVFYEILHGVPTPLHEYVPSCPPQLNTMVLKCLEKNPDDRYSTFEAILAQIHEILEELDDDTLQVTTTRQMPTPLPQVIDSDSHKQAELLAKMGGLPGEGPAPEDMQKLQRLAERAKAAVDSGDLTGAEVSIDLARRDHSDTIVFHQLFDPLVERLAEIKKQREAEIRSQEKADSLLDTARSARKKGNLKKALDTARKCLELDPAPQEARELVVELERELEEQRVREQREKALHEAIIETESLLSSNDPEGAARRLETARKELGEEPPFAALAEAIDSQRQQLIVRGLLQQAREALEDGQLEKALGLARRALETAPGDAGSSALLRQVESAIEEQRRREERQRSLNEQRGQIEQTLAGGDLERAFALFGAAIQQFGEDPVLAPLGERIEQARLEQRQSELRARALEALEGGDLAGCDVLLQEARGIGDQSQELGALRARLEEAIETLRRQEELDEAVRQAIATIEQALDGGDPDQAAALLESARERLGADDRLEPIHLRVEKEQRRARLTARVDDATRHLEKGELEAGRAAIEEARELGDDPRLDELSVRIDREQRGQRADELLSAAQEEISAGRLERALDPLRQALALVPDHSAGALLEEAEAELARREEAERRRKALEKAVAAVEAHLDAGELDNADRGVAQARKEFGDEPILADISERLSHARLSRRVAGLLAEVEDAVAAADLERARGIAQGALEELPGRTEFETKIEEIDRAIAERTERERLAEEERKKRALHDALAVIEGAVSANELRRAEKSLAKARSDFEPTPEFDRLERMIEDARLEQRVAQALAEVDRAVATEELDRARQLATGALEELPGRSEIEAKLAEVERALEERAERERVERERKKEAERLQKLTREASARVEERLGQNDLAGAAKALAKARKDLGDPQALPALAEALDTARRRDRATEISAEATRLIEAEEWHAALQKAEAALELDADSKPARQVSERARGAIERERAEREREEQRVRALGQIEQLIVRGRGRQARKLLEKTLGTHGADEALTALEPRLVTAEKTEAEKAGVRRKLVLAAVAAVAAIVAAVVLLPRLIGNGPETQLAQTQTPAETSPAELDRSLPTATPPPNVTDDPARSPGRAAAVQDEATDAPTQRQEQAKPKEPEPAATRPATRPPATPVAAPTESPTARDSSKETPAREDPPVELEPKPAPTEDRQVTPPAIDDQGKTDEASTRDSAPASASPRETADRRERETEPPVTPAARSRPEPTPPAERPTEPEPKTAPTVVDETPLIQAALRQYEQAYEALDADAVLAINPTANHGDLERSFRNLRSLAMEMDLSSCRYQVNGDRATARCRVVRTMEAKAGGRERTNTATEIYELSKRDGSWKILSWSISQ